MVDAGTGARAPNDAAEELEIRRLAASRTAPRGVSQRASIVALSWGGANTRAIAEETGLHPKTVRLWLGRFNTDGVLGLAERRRPGRPRMLDTRARQWLVTTAAGADTWTLSALVAAAAKAGIAISRSQVRRVLLDAGVAWHSSSGATRKGVRNNNGTTGRSRGGN